MKLYPILFSEEQLKLLSPEQMKAPPSAFKHIPPHAQKHLGRFGPPDFALHSFIHYEQCLALIHGPTFRNYIQSRFNAELFPVESWLCAYASSYHLHPPTECSNAVEVNYMVASPQYPGAGGAMYALISKFFNKPITSDRHGSTSDSAKKAWARIEQDSSNWQKVPLDNFRPAPYLTYYDDQGHWPNRTITALHKPKTKTPTDDCPLPKPDNRSDPQSIDGVLGSADAWLYIGDTLDPQPLLANLPALFDSLRKDNVTDKNNSFLQQLIQGRCDILFQKFYHGVTG